MALNANTTNIDAALEREFVHPLKALPGLNRLPNNTWVAVAMTATLCALVALVLTALGGILHPDTGIAEVLYINLIYSNSVGFSIHLLSELFVPKFRLWLRGKAFIVRLGIGLILWICGAVLGSLMAATILDHDGRTTHSLFTALVSVLVLASITGVALRKQALRELRRERERSERSEAQRLLATSRLRLLQAQIEPHFLFNTLANVSTLIEVDPRQARKMLDQFTLLLRASLDQTRHATTTLRAELQLIEAYLSVLKVRMGERLSYRVEAPPELQNIEVPSMLLQPIVENAVKHGIEPRMTGGVVQVEVRHQAESLQFIVTDDGVGFITNGKENIGLGAVRERLAVQYGDVASLKIERTPDNLTCVTIQIPFPSVMPS